MLRDFEYKKINEEYLDYIYSLVCNNPSYSRYSYKKLFSLLHSIEFIYENNDDIYDYPRAHDGEDFRFRYFGPSYGYDNDHIDQALNDKPCSVLEMMIALSRRIEDQIMSNTKYGDRISQWFWYMIDSLGLNHMTDLEFDETESRIIIEKFLHRNYGYNGKGGLFIIKNPPRDLRSADIWAQACWFLNEVEE